MYSGFKGFSISNLSTTSPFKILITVSAILDISLLCVIKTMLVPKSLFKSLNVFKAIIPVLLSKAPVGSSHKTTLGFFAIALAMLTLCCSLLLYS